MKNLMVTALFVIPVCVGCQSVDTKEAETGLGTNAVNYEAQRTSGSPHFPATEMVANKKSANVEGPAPAPIPAPKVVVSKPIDRCMPVTKSPGAVGLPCETTRQFIESLGLPKKQQQLAFSMVARADREFAGSAPAH